MTGWQRLREELALWQALGQSPTLWLRDDDAVAPSAALDRLLGLGLPVALAVIPANATVALAARLAGEPQAWILQHGWSHTNHAPVGQKKKRAGGGQATGCGAG